MLAGLVLALIGGLYALLYFLNGRAKMPEGVSVVTGCSTCNDEHCSRH